MIGYIEGDVVSVQISEVIIKVNGIGYEIQMGPETISRLNLAPGMTVDLFTDMIVREDSIKIFGFENEPSKYMFRLLLTVNGVGAKLAYAVIDHLEPGAFILAVQQGNPKPFEGVSGVGKRVAQKIVLELENKLQKFTQIFDHIQPNESIRPATTGSEMDDLISALSNLGYNQNIVEKTVKSLWTDNSNFEKMFHIVLKQLSKS